MIIQEKNWPYKIAFDNTMYRELKEYSFSLHEKEQELMKYQIDFFRNNFSMEQIIYCLQFIKNDKNFEKFKAAVLKRINNLVYTPPQLKAHYKKIIDDGNKKYADFLNYLLQQSLTKGIIPKQTMFYKTIFGKHYKAIKKECISYSKRKFFNVSLNKLKNSEIGMRLKNIQSAIQKDYILQAYWGKFENTDYKVLENSDLGNGKWFSKYISTYDDTFVVNTCHSNLTDIKLNYSYYLNVYPGFGNFYNTILKNNKEISFDSGAGFLINGWATFSAWHIKPSAYTKNSKALHCKIAAFLLKRESKKSYDELYSYLLNRYDKEKTIRYMIEISQYPMRYESYVLGALAVELLVDKVYGLGPINFLKEIRKRNLGNFFTLYNQSK